MNFEIIDLNKIKHTVTDPKFSIGMAKYLMEGASKEQQEYWTHFIQQIEDKVFDQECEQNIPFKKATITGLKGLSFEVEYFLVNVVNEIALIEVKRHIHNRILAGIENESIEIEWNHETIRGHWKRI